MTKLPTLAGYDCYADMPDGYVYDPERGDHVVDFFRQCLVHVKDSVFCRAGQPLILEPWQETLMRMLFGVVHRETGLRRYRQVYLETARKSGKSTLSAGALLYYLFTQREQGGELYCLAASRDQASTIFGMCESMIRRSKHMKKRSTIRPSAKRISVAADDTYLQCAASNDANLHGTSPSFVALDEVHVIKHGLYDVVQTGQAARAQPVLFMTTTSGWDRSSKCFELSQHARRVRDGVVSDPTFLPCLFVTEPDEDWTSPDVWRKANPNIDKTVSMEFLEQKCKAAQQRPSEQNSFRQLHLSQWVSQRTRFLDTNAWVESDTSTETVEFDPDYPIVGGLDISHVDDLTSFCMVQVVDDIIRCRWLHWCPQTKLDSPRTDGVDYSAWERSGHINVIDGPRIRLNDVVRDIIDICHELGITTIGYDAKSAEWAVQQFEVEDIEATAIKQGWALSEQAKRLESAIVEKRVRHGSDPVTTWCVDNISAKHDDHGNVYIGKENKDSSRKVDAVIALVTALAVEAELPETDDGSYYAQEGSLFL